MIVKLTTHSNLCGPSVKFPSAKSYSFQANFNPTSVLANPSQGGQIQLIKRSQKTQSTPDAHAVRALGCDYANLGVNDGMTQNCNSD